MLRVGARVWAWGGCEEEQSDSGRVGGQRGGTPTQGARGRREHSDPEEVERRSLWGGEEEQSD